MFYLVSRVKQSSHQLDALRTFIDNDPFMGGLLFMDRLCHITEIAFRLQTTGDVFDTLACGSLVSFRRMLTTIIAHRVQS